MKKVMSGNYWIVLFVITISFSSCKDGFNVFSIQDDIDLGTQVDAEIRADPATYPILDELQYSSAYTYLKSMRDEILNGGNVEHVSDFEWKLAIIEEDNILNAFATPGGYIYVYTGLIKYLDNASSLAGVMGHEIAHADRRHSTNQLTKAYSVSLLLEALGGNQSLLTQIAADLIFLKFTRSNETDADNHSVEYLCPTKYKAEGASYFFQKIIDQGSASPPEFLSTHPSPDNRVENIQGMATDAACSPTITDTEEDAGYLAFKNTLP